jgi:hypothetical protein
MVMVAYRERQIDDVLGSLFVNTHGLQDFRKVVSSFRMLAGSRWQIQRRGLTK